MVTVLAGTRLPAARTDLLARFDELGYEVEFRKLCAADFGVPQLRHRVFFFAVRKDVADATGLGPRFPRQTNANSAENGLPLMPAYHTVMDAFEGLPVAEYAPKDAFARYTKE